MRAAYEENVKLSQKGEAKQLTTGDVFRWMVDEGLFPREAPKKRHNSILEGIQMVKLSAQSPPFDYGTFCSNCGLDHQPAVKSESPTDPPVCPIICRLVNRLPIMELTRLLCKPSLGASHTHQGPVPQIPEMPKEFWRDLVAITTPAFTLAVRDVVTSLKLRAFPQCRSSPFPLIELGGNATEIDSHMAPFALMSVVTMSFIRILVKGGLRIADQDFSSDDDSRRNVRAQLLTPSHILRGLYNSTGSEVGAVLLCMARLGVDSTFSHTALGNVGTAAVVPET